MQIKCLLSCLVIIKSPVNQSVCAGETVNFTCIVMFTSGSLNFATWFSDNGNVLNLLGHTETNDINGCSAPANVTNVLSVTNVSISDNGRNYVCVQDLNTRSDTIFLTVIGELSVHLCVCL